MTWIVEVWMVNYETWTRSMEFPHSYGPEQIAQIQRRIDEEVKRVNQQFDINLRYRMRSQ